MDRQDDRHLTPSHDGEGALGPGPSAASADGEGGVLAVHFGRSANCSSVGSVVDVLFVSSVVGTALLGAIAVLMRRGADGRSEAEAEPEPEPGPAPKPEGEDRDEDRADSG